MINLIFISTTYLFLSFGSIGIYELISLPPLSTGWWFSVARLIMMMLMFNACILLRKNNKIDPILTITFFLLILYTTIKILLSVDYVSILRVIQKSEPILITIILYVIINNLVYDKKNDYLMKFVNFSLFILFLTVIYKLHFGFWDRGTRFFLNGPIVFSWICGLNLLFCLYHYSLQPRFITIIKILIFLLVLLWAATKGTILALILPTIFIFFCFYKFKKLVSISGFFSICAVIILFLDLVPDRIQAAINLGSSNEINFGSIKIRLYMWENALQTFWENPAWGIGIGAWEYTAANKIFIYPHNIFLEILSEHGVFGFLFLFLIFLIVFIKATKLGKILFFYFLLCLSFSGDMAEWYFLLVVPICFGSKNYEKMMNKEV